MHACAVRLVHSPVAAPGGCRRARGRGMGFHVKATPHPDVERILFSVDQISDKVEELGRQLARDYASQRPLVIGTLRGAVLFMSDLVRCMDPVPPGLELDFVRASSYGAGTTSSGTVSLLTSGSSISVEGRHVLLVEDIVDSGLTASELIAHYQRAGAASVKLVSLLSKPSRREVAMEPDYCGFEVEDLFVVGYGLDYDQRYRSLPYIGVLRRELYAPE